MLRTALYIIFFATLTSCQKESFYRLTPSETIAVFVPRYDGIKRFVSNTGDTLYFFQAAFDTNYVKTPQSIGNTGNLGSLDYVEVQEHYARIINTTGLYTFTYHLTSKYNSSLGSRSEDLLTINFYEGKQDPPVSMILTYTDTLTCVSPRCAFQAGMTMQTKTFSNVYYLARDSVNIPALYINQTRGVVGFKTSANKVFELID